jgi:hypothetical protein
MSRGPGRIEREIARLFKDNPSRAFFVEDIGKVLFPLPRHASGKYKLVDSRSWRARWVPVRAKKHRVTILRAARHVAARLWWGVHYFSQREKFASCISTSSI